MEKKALVVIDIQNDITKNYKDVIGGINQAVDWAVANGIHVVYTRHENLSAGTRTLKPGTFGSELATDLKVASKNVFVKSKTNILTCEALSAFIEKHGIREFYLTGADAAICVKSSCYNLRKAGYGVTVVSDCVTSYDKRKIGEMLEYYAAQGSEIVTVKELLK